jgi:hypothetical protein
MYVLCPCSSMNIEDVVGYYSSILSEFIDPGFMSIGFPTKPLKLSALLVNQKATQHTECVAQSHPR